MSSTVCLFAVDGELRTGELTLSLPRKPRTDFGAETGHPAEADTSPEQVRISISPSERRHGDGNGDPVEGHIGGRTRICQLRHRFLAETFRR